ncbi:MAG TPA: hypothetical protein PK659_09610 [Methanothrix sp.]|nr:hypothetical protein [Methanothrix sp.]HOL44496.1 hypothetical protein [Methanothrix sp.]
MKEIDVIFDDVMHSQLHASGAEHRHGYGRDTIVVEAVFSPQKAYGLLPLSDKHDFKTDTQFVVIDSDEPVKYEDSFVWHDEFTDIQKKLSRPVLNTRKVSLESLVSEVARRDMVVSVDADPLLDMLRQWVKQSEELRKEFKKLDTEYKEQIKKAREELEALARERAEQIACEEAERARLEEAFRKEMDRWILENGSERLRKGRAHGYKCKRLYLEERGQAEHGEDYILVRDRRTEYRAYEIRERSCPSLEAIEEMEQQGLHPQAIVRVVWANERDEWRSGGREAVCVKRPDLDEAVYIRFI